MCETVAGRQADIAQGSRGAGRSEPALLAAFRGASLRFYVCVSVLLLAAVSMQSVARMLGGHFRKAAVPLKRPLDELNQSKLLPEYEPHRIQPKPLSEEELANLGAQDYLQWYLRDRERPPDDPQSRVLLFITYHTGEPDAVPHNPRECHAAGGMSLRDETLVELQVPGPDGAEVTIPVSVLEFELPGSERLMFLRPDSVVAPRRVVSYFFYANGRFTTTRTGVRRAVANLWDRYAYYCKLELTFSDDSGRVLADRRQTIAATRRLLRKLMPILWEDHFQDWEALRQGAAPVIADQRG